MSLLDLVSGAIRLGKAIKQAVEDKLAADEKAQEVSSKVEALMAPVSSLQVARIPDNRAYVFSKALQNMAEVLEATNTFVLEYADLVSKSGKKADSLLGFGMKMFSTLQVYGKSSDRILEFDDALKRLDSASTTLTTAVSSASLLMQMEGPVTAASLCRHGSAKAFWTRYFQDAHTVTWTAFEAAFVNEFGKLRPEHMHLIHQRLDADMDHSVSIFEFAMFTNSLGVPDSFQELLTIVEESSPRRLKLRYHDACDVDVVLDAVGAQFGMPGDLIREATAHLRSHWFTTVGQLRAMNDAQWEQFMSLHGLPFRLCVHLRKTLAALTVEPSNIPEDVALVSYVRKIKKLTVTLKDKGKKGDDGKAKKGGKGEGKGEGKASSNTSGGTQHTIAKLTEALEALACLNVDVLEFKRYSHILQRVGAYKTIVDALVALGAPFPMQPKRVWPHIWQQELASPSDKKKSGAASGTAMSKGKTAVGLFAAICAGATTLLAEGDLAAAADAASERKEAVEGAMDKAGAVACKLRNGPLVLEKEDTGGPAGWLNARTLPAVVAGVKALANVVSFGPEVMATKSVDKALIPMLLTLLSHHTALIADDDLQQTLLDAVEQTVHTSHTIKADSKLIAFGLLTAGVDPTKESAFDDDICTYAWLTCLVFLPLPVPGAVLGLEYDPWCVNGLTFLLRNKSGTERRTLVAETFAVIMDVVVRVADAFRLSTKVKTTECANSFTRDLETSVEYRTDGWAYDSDDWSDSEYSDSDDDSDDEEEEEGEVEEENGEEKAEEVGEEEVKVEVDDAELASDGEGDEEDEEGEEEEDEGEDVEVATVSDDENDAEESKPGTTWDPALAQRQAVTVVGREETHELFNAQLLPAVFGPQVSDALMNTPLRLVAMDPPDGRGDTVHNGDDLSGNVVLVARSEDDTVAAGHPTLQAAAHGAAAVIVVNTRQVVPGARYRMTLVGDSEGESDDDDEDDDDSESDSDDENMGVLIVAKRRARRRVLAKIATAGVPTLMASHEAGAHLYAVADEASAYLVLSDGVESPSEQMVCSRHLAGEGDTQDLFMCMTCGEDGTLDEYNFVCVACAESCHLSKGHRVVQLFNHDLDTCECVEKTCCAQAPPIVPHTHALAASFALDSMRAVLGLSGVDLKDEAAPGAGVAADGALQPQASINLPNAGSILSDALGVLATTSADLSRPPVLDAVLSCAAQYVESSVFRPVIKALMKYRRGRAGTVNEKAFVEALARSKLLPVVGFHARLLMRPKHARQVVGFIASLLGESTVGDYATTAETNYVLQQQRVAVKRLFFDTNWTAFRSLQTLLWRHASTPAFTQDTIVVLLRMATCARMQTDTVTAMNALRFHVTLGNLVMQAPADAPWLYNALELLYALVNGTDDNASISLCMIAEHPPLVDRLIALTPTSTASYGVRVLSSLVLGRLMNANPFCRYTATRSLLAAGTDSSDILTVAVDGATNDVAISWDNYICDGCDMDPIVGLMYDCTKCFEKQFCSKCVDTYEGQKHKPNAVHRTVPMGFEPFPYASLEVDTPPALTTASYPQPMWAPYDVPEEDLTAYPFTVDASVPVFAVAEPVAEVAPPPPLGDVPMVHQAGVLTKMGGKVKSWRRRYAVLSGTTLSYYKSSNAAQYGGSPLKTITITATDVVELAVDEESAKAASMATPLWKRMWVPTKPAGDCFGLQTGTRRWLFGAQGGTRDAWVAALQAAVKLAAMAPPA